MLLDNAPAAYDQTDQARLRHTLIAEDKKNAKAGTVYDKILMRDTVTGAVVVLTVASGVLVIT